MEHDVKIVQVLVELDLAISILVHDCEHSITQETQRVNGENAQGLFVRVMTHLTPDGEFSKPLVELQEFVVCELVDTSPFVLHLQTIELLVIHLVG